MGFPVSFSASRWRGADAPPPGLLRRCAPRNDVEEFGNPVIASHRVRPEVTGPTTGSAKQSRSQSHKTGLPRRTRNDKVRRIAIFCQARMPRFASLADLHTVIARLPPGDAAAADAVASREATLTKPPRSLGRLEDLVTWLARWQGKNP